MPTYLALSDIGFGNASGNDMTARVAGRDRLGALVTFQSSWLLLTVTSGLAISLASLLAWSVSWTSLLNLSTVNNEVATTILLTLSAYALLGQQASIIESGYRCDGHYATGTVGLTLCRFSEALAATLTGILTGSLLLTAITSLVGRMISLCVYRWGLRTRSPWLTLGVAHAQRHRVRALLAPALGFVAFPGALAISVQGATMLVGAQFGPIAAVGFSTARTLTRVVTQLLNTISCTVWPLLSAAFGSNDLQLARKLHRQSFTFAILLSVPCCAILWVLGPDVYRLWTHGQVHLDPRIFHVLIAVAFANALWFTSFAVPMSRNRHHWLAWTYCAASAAALLTAWAATGRFGPTVVALCLLAAEIGMAALVLPAALRQTADTPREFLASRFKLSKSTRFARQTNKPVDVLSA